MSDVTLPGEWMSLLRGAPLIGAPVSLGLVGFGNVVLQVATALALAVVVVLAVRGAARSSTPGGRHRATGKATQ